MKLQIVDMRTWRVVSSLSENQWKECAEAVVEDYIHSGENTGEVWHGKFRWRVSNDNEGTVLTVSCTCPQYH